MPREGKIMSTIITISREFGSGGREIGFRLAKNLGIPFYDRELMSRAAEDSNIAEDVFHANDEKIAHMKRKNDSEYITVAPYSPVYEIPVSDQLFVIQSKIIRLIAQEGSCVIIGRCSDVIIENSFRVFVTASLKKRMERLIALEKEPDVDIRKMEAHIRDVDRRRREYYQYYSGNEWGKPKNYDLCLNSGTLGVAGCVEMIAAGAAL